MYDFQIEREGNKAWKFERDGIKIIMDAYLLKDDSHVIINPINSLAYFYIDGNIYAFRNRFTPCKTAEDFFDLIKEQMAMLKKTA